MNILSIGNSYAHDAHRYLHAIAAADKYPLTTFNLYIGGCSFERHFRNMMTEERAYTLEMNGESTGFPISIKEALLNRAWDAVTIHQASINSPNYDSYQPYANRLVDYIKLCVPKTKIVVHQTWAYEADSAKLHGIGYDDPVDMFRDIEAAYASLAAEVGADIIPSGKLLQKLIENGITPVHRDTYHLALGTGRYAVGLLWYAWLTGNSVTDNSFRDFDEDIPEDVVAKIKKCVSEVL